MVAKGMVNAIMENRNLDYRSFLLRIWIERTNSEKWRYSLEDTRTGKRKGFASIEKLITYLNELRSDAGKLSEQKE